MQSEFLYRPGVRFLVRWAANGIGLWLAALLLSNRISVNDSFVFIIAGLILALLNMLIKPLLVVLSLPALIFSLGLFMIIINGALVWLASVLYAPLHVAGFGAAILAGVIIGMVNWLVSGLVKEVTR